MSNSSDKIAMVMLSCDRPRLTAQAIQTMTVQRSSIGSVVVMDCSSDLEMQIKSLRSEFPWAIVHKKGLSKGKARNEGVRLALNLAPDAEWVHLTENDAWFSYGWAYGLLAAAKSRPDIWVMGGYNHPYHHPIDPIEGGAAVRVYHQQVGLSMLMRVDRWHQIGGFADSSDSEDVEFCGRVQAAGGKLGAVWPHVILDCGVTTTKGVQATGADLMVEALEEAKVTGLADQGIYYE